MISMQAFFNTLISSPGFQISHTGHVNDQSTSTADLTMMTNQNHQPGPRTLYAYLTQLQTPDCYIPKHLQTNPGPTTPSYPVTHQSIGMMIANDCHPNQHMVSMGLDLSCPYMHHDVPQPLLAKVLPTQLDHPPDHFSYATSNLQSAPCRAMSLYPRQPNTRQQYTGQENCSLRMGASSVYPESPRLSNITRRSIIQTPTQHIVTSATRHAGNNLRPP